MKNVNGSVVVFRSNVHLPNRIADNDSLLPIEPGSSAVVVGSNSHGYPPYTRYNVMFEDGSRAYNVEPQIFKVVH